MVDEQRLGELFETLVKIDSPSGEEKEISIWLKNYLENLGCRVAEDDAAEKLGTQANNLVGKFAGTIDIPPIMLCGHMDTVEPGRGVIPVFKDGVYRSKGRTILGADDKSALAIILEVLNILKDSDFDYCPVDVIFTVFEEGGLKGAKVFDASLIKSNFGYILDSTDTDGIVVSAPCCNKMTFKINGKTAHAGAAPEKGINAIKIAGKALAKAESGRIDHETTCNIGLISGGTATNIVPDHVVVEAEARSHDPEKLKRVTENLKNAFEEAVKEASGEFPDQGLPSLDYEIQEEFPNVILGENEKAVLIGKEAARKLGFELKEKIVGGGSDANVFFHKGIKVGVIGTGMKDIHTTDENIALKDMVSCCHFLVEAIKYYSGEYRK